MNKNDFIFNDTASLEIMDKDHPVRNSCNPRAIVLRFQPKTALRLSQSN